MERERCRMMRWLKNAVMSRGRADDAGATARGRVDCTSTYRMNSHTITILTHPSTRSDDRPSGRRFIPGSNEN
jgi:hypothetical protein